ncbi:glycosyltransferase involved in cell wall biosynthesis [Microbacterium terrae]|uniref:glycosyltransferase n=1 Tax=Microbacterium terrae TaxID=69369 RepID=UPI0006968B5F|nr:glycosyltransferase [Microbacterium terrae]MBP1078558.1 glycosyltransferase involved in cell wall biosynthesis [Microbacterium terrae]
MSVIIPAYNAAEFLGAQLTALDRQDDAPHFEILVCDNGSTDDTAAIVRAFQEQNPRLRLIDASRRRGASAARNIGAEHATAPLLLFCDADDVVDNGWVGALRRALDDCAFVAGGVEHRMLNPGREWDFGWDRPTFHDPALPQFPACGSGNMGIRAEVFAAVSGFDESLDAGEDIDFAWRVQLAGSALADVPSAILHYRKRGGIAAAVRQGRAKGAGTRVLAHRFALLRAAYADAAQAQRPPMVEQAAPTKHRAGAGKLDRLRRLPRKVSEIARNPAAITPYIAAIAFRWGFQTASLADIAQIPVPDPLPPAPR